MSLFNPTVTLDRCSFFEGYTDCHCHILPGVDDGFKTMEDSLEILSTYAEAGIRKVWLTPHIMEDMPNTPESLSESFEELRSAYTGPVELCLAAENMMDVLFKKRFAENNLLTLGQDMLLVETSYFSPPMDLHKILSKIKSIGLNPLLAHPERYMYMDMDEYTGLKDEGIRFQLNLLSLSGAYGNKVKEKAEKMLKKGYYDFSGTDLHRKSMFEGIRTHAVPKKLAALIPNNQKI